MAELGGYTEEVRYFYKKTSVPRMHSAEALSQSSETWMCRAATLGTLNYQSSHNSRKPPGCSPAVYRQQQLTCPCLPVGPAGSISTVSGLSPGSNPWLQASSEG